MTNTINLLTDAGSLKMKSHKKGDLDNMATNWKCGVLFLLFFFLLTAFHPVNYNVTNEIPSALSTEAPILQTDIGLIDDEPVDPETWRSIHLEIENPDDSITTIDLLRPLWWLEDFSVEIGGTVSLDMPEMAIKGEAKVLDIGPCKIDSNKVDSNNRIVTGKFKHENTVVLDLYFDNNTEKPLGVTPKHPLWSASRDTWAEAGSLQIGEYIKTKDGIVQLTSRSQRQGKYKVYNLEVHQNHTFYVSNFAILAHNNKAKPGQKKPKKPKKKNPLDDPKIAKEIDLDPNAVNGYSPKPGSSLSKFKVDWSNPKEVEFAKGERIKYLKELEKKKKLLDGEIARLKKKGMSMEDIARKKVDQRNQDRIDSYIKSGNLEGLEAMKKRNLQDYGRAEGPTADQLFKDKGSWDEVVYGSVRSSPAMDVLVGLY